MQRKIAKVLAYDAATELGLARDLDEEHWLFEGPVVNGMPFRWIKSASFDVLSIEYPKLLESARRAL